jgi:hypothetical protein
MSHGVTTVLNERNQLKMVISSVPDSVNFTVDRIDRAGLTESIERANFTPRETIPIVLHKNTL